MSIRNYVPFLFLLLLGTSSCNKNEDNRSSGTILREDNAVCACCGGYIIVINRFTYRFFAEDIPNGNTLLDGATFPLDVLVRFENEGTDCNGINRIKLQSLEES